MATEKILNTRIQLRYDSLTNWMSSTIALKAGEVAIAYLGESHTTATPDNGTHPVMFKVGPGLFKDLPWVSALAADVYSWAKQSDKVFVDNFLSMVATDGKTMSEKLNDVFATDAELSAAITALRTELTGNDGLAGLAARVKAIEDAPYVKAADIANMATDAEVEAAVLVETNRAKAEEERLAGLINAIDFIDETELAAAIKVETDRALLAEQGLGARIDAIDFIDGDELNLALNPYAKSADVAATYETIAEADKVRARVKAIEDAPYATQAYADQAEADAKKDAADKLAAARTEITAEIAQAISDSATTEGGVIAGVKADVEAAHEAADEAMEKAEEGVTKAEAAQIAAEAAQKTIDDFLTGENVSEAVDTLKEIQEELKTLGEAVELTEAFAAKADKVRKIEGVDGLVGGGDLSADRTIGLSDATKASLALADSAIQPGVLTTTLADYYTKTAADAEFMNAGEVDAKIAAAFNGDNSIKVDEAAHADVAAKASGLDDAGVAAVKAVKVDNAGHADAADDATKLGGVEAGNYLLKTEAPGYADILTKTLAGTTYEPIGAESRANAYADGLAKNYDEAGAAAAAETAAKSYADGLAVNYATAAQGATADSAVQSVAAGEGLKATREGNAVTVGFDPDVVFVFDCGNASGAPLNA